MTPWLSILIPVYNVEPYLEACLDSVLTQTDAGVEVVLLDDASTDGSASIAKRRAQADPRLRCLRHEVNQGLSAARNTMIEESRGDYLWFLDSDDALEPGAVKALEHIVQTRQPDMVLCDHRKWREKQTFKHRWRGENHVSSFAGPARQLVSDASATVGGLFTAGQLHAWSKITRRSLWRDDLRFPVGRYFEDMAVSARLALRARNVWYEPQVWVAYRQRGGSILATMNERKADHLAQALEPFIQEAQQRVLSEEARFAWAYFAARNFITACRAVSRVGSNDMGLRLREHLEALKKALPMSVAELYSAYGRRRWYWRRRRLRYWLKRADAQS